MIFDEHPSIWVVSYSSSNFQGVRLDLPVSSLSLAFTLNLMGENKESVGYYQEWGSWPSETEFSPISTSKLNYYNWLMVLYTALSDLEKQKFNFIIHDLTSLVWDDFTDMLKVIINLDQYVYYPDIHTSEEFLAWLQESKPFLFSAASPSDYNSILDIYLDSRDIDFGPRGMGFLKEDAVLRELPSIPAQYEVF